MRISVNLATRPFVELRPFFLRLRIVMGALVLVGIAAAVTSHILQKKLDVAQAKMNVLVNQTTAYQMEKLHNEQRMRQPANAAVLDRAHFLNALFLRKSFSWTAVMMDLETVLPVGVQITSIEPQIQTDGSVVIRLRVSGDRDRAVQLVRNLERSKRFLSPRLSSESVQAKENASPVNNGSGAPAGVEFEILANYNPLPEGQPYATVKKASAEATEKAPTDKRAALQPRSSSPVGNGYGVVLKPYSATHPKPAKGGTR
jgi:type IV pilus assembly protein PilN